MGSFNDLGGGPYFDNIQSIAYHLARNPDNKESIEKSMGTLGLQLTGYHCYNCGYDEVYKRNIQTYVQNIFVRADVFEYYNTKTLLELAKKRHDFDFSSLAEDIKAIIEVAENNGISVVEDHPWSDTCPKCTKKGIEIMHWVLNESGDKFIPFQLDAKTLPDNIRSAFK